MQVKTAGGHKHFPPGDRIKAILEDGADFTLQFEDGSTAPLQLANRGASVSVRDKNNKVEYLG